MSIQYIQLIHYAFEATTDIIDKWSEENINEDNNPLSGYHHLYIIFVVND